MNDTTDTPARGDAGEGGSVFSSAEPGAPPDAADRASQRSPAGLPPSGLEALAKRRWRERIGWGPVGLYASDDRLSRGLILLWCLWLLGSWTVALLLDPSLTSERKVRWMMMASMVGLTLVWPVLRLSQDDAPREDDPSGGGASGGASGGGGGGGAAAWGLLRDWMSLNVVFQAVIWPLRLSTNWSLEQTLYLDGSVAAWSLVTAGLMALGIRRGGGWRRAGWALACAAVLVAEPVWLALAGAAGAGWLTPVEPSHWSPLLSVWRLSEPALGYRPDAAAVAATAIAGALLWTAAVNIHRRRRLDV